MISVDPRHPRGIIWLASYPKSGNTWLRMFLHQIALIRRGLPRGEDEINKIERSSPTEIGFTQIYEKLLGKSVPEISILDALKVRRAVHAEIARALPSVVMLKTHSVLGSYDGMDTINHEVTAGAVYLVRDPRDVAVSLASHLATSIDEAIETMNTLNRDVSETSRVVGEIWGSWSQNVQSWTDSRDPSRLVLRYEDMLKRPNETFASVTRHLRQATTPEMIETAIQASSFEVMQRQEDKFGFVGGGMSQDRFFATGKAGGWRDKLTTAQADAIVAAHGPTMRKFGYLD